MSIANRIQLCIDNYQEYVEQLAAMPDKELAKKLDLVHIQMELAEQNKNEASIELLEVWRTQIIDARIYKIENSIPDATNEIELAVVDIETFVGKTEIREEAVNALTPSYRPKKQQENQNNDEQLKLF